MKEVVYIPPKSPVSPRYVCTMTRSFTNIFPLGFSSYNVSCFLNSPFQCFNTGNNYPAASQGSSVTDNATGYASLCNGNFYLRSRVVASSCRVLLIPGVATDELTCSLCPSTTLNTPASIQIASGQPYNKTWDCMYLKEIDGKSSGSNRISVHKLVGVTRQAIENDLSGQFNANFGGFPLNKLYWTLNFATLDNVATTAIIQCRVLVKYKVELYEPANMNLLT